MSIAGIAQITFFRLIPPYSAALFRLIRFTLQLRRCGQKPHGPSTMSAGIDQPKSFQMKQIVTQSTVSHSRIDLRANTGEWAFHSAGNSLKNPALPICKVMGNAERRHITAWQEPNAYRPGDLQELRFRMAGPKQSSTIFCVPRPQRSTSPRR